MGNLAWTVTWQDLKDHMRSAGNVVRADVLTMPDGRSKVGVGVAMRCGVAVAFVKSFLVRGCCWRRWRGAVLWWCHGVPAC